MAAHFRCLGTSTPSPDPSADHGSVLWSCIPPTPRSSVAAGEAASGARPGRSQSNRALVLASGSGLEGAPGPPAASLVACARALLQADTVAAGFIVERFHHRPARGSTHEYGSSPSASSRCSLSQPRPMLIGRRSARGGSRFVAECWLREPERDRGARALGLFAPSHEALGDGADQPT
jgi:hypothetical protein